MCFLQYRKDEYQIFQVLRVGDFSVIMTGWSLKLLFNIKMSCLEMSQLIVPVFAWREKQLKFISLFYFVSPLLFNE